MKSPHVVHVAPQLMHVVPVNVHESCMLCMFSLRSSTSSVPATTLVRTTPVPHFRCLEGTTTTSNVLCVLKSGVCVCVCGCGCSCGCVGGCALACVHKHAGVNLPLFSRVCAVYICM